MSTYRFLFLLCVFSSLSFTAQVKDDMYTLDTPRDYSKFPAMNANYIEILGNAGLYSINFDRVLIYSKMTKVTGRIGAMIWPVGYNIEQAYVFENNYFFFDGDHHLEIGPGVTLQRKFNPVCSDTTEFPKYKWENVWFGMFRLGYRYQRQDEGFFFRFGLTPIFYRKYDCAADFPPDKWFWLGISVGVSY
jgi:hypothetical protein